MAFMSKQGTRKYKIYLKWVNNTFHFRAIILMQTYHHHIGEQNAHTKYNGQNEIESGAFHIKIG